MIFLECFGVHACMGAYMHVCVHVCACLCICAHVYVYIAYIYTYDLFCLLFSFGSKRGTVNDSLTRLSVESRAGLCETTPVNTTEVLAHHIQHAFYSNVRSFFFKSCGPISFVSTLAFTIGWEVGSSLVIFILSKQNNTVFCEGVRDELCVAGPNTPIVG